MKAASINSYGSAEQVQISDVQMPSVPPGHVLVRMKAASVNPIDWKMAKGDLKALAKSDFPVTLGHDGAGIIEQLGKDVSTFETGDEVYFRCFESDTGTYAQYFAIDASLVSKKPETMSFEQAASIPLVGLTSLQVLRERGQMKPDSKVLIHAGAGGVGTFAIQFAKACGAYVATTASKKRNSLLTELGADEIIDYKTQQFEDVLTDYDLVFDTLGGSVQDASYKVLKRGGILVSVLGMPEVTRVKQLTSNVLIVLVSWFHNRKKKRQATKYGVTYKHHFMYSNGSQLEEIATLIDAGKIKAVIDSTYTLDQVAEAFERSMTGRVQGKVIITID